MTDVELHTAAETAAILGVSETLVRKNVRERVWPARRLGGLKFTDADIAEIIELSKIAPAVADKRRPGQGATRGNRGLRPA
jgi:hypothetical protein